MSKCKRPMLPAFSLDRVHQTTHEAQDDTPACAAKAEAMSTILPHVCLGSWHDAEDQELITRAGITHVLNVAKEVPSPTEQACMDAIRSVSKLQIPLVDAHSEDILPHFEDAFSFIEEARRQNGKVLVHCRRGISRSPAIVTGYIMTKTQCSYEAALTYVKERRSSVSLNLAFRTILEDYQPKNPTPDEEMERLIRSKSEATIGSSSDAMTNEAESNASTSSNHKMPMGASTQSPDAMMSKTGSYLAEDEPSDASNNNTAPTPMSF